jgi:peptidoglycan/LPS O-acetylase OafA/YrhL
LARRLECLDGLRGLLALYVLVSHMAAFAVLPVWIRHPFAHGEAAVDLFFVLSGMVIVRSLDSFGYDRGRFLLARAARTMPAFLVVFAVAVAVQPLPTALPWMGWVAADDPGRTVWSTGWPAHWAAEIGAHLTMTHGLIPNAVLPNAWISFLGCAWSLSTEWQFYAVIALLAPVLRAVADPGRAMIGLSRLFLVVAALALVWAWTAPDGGQFSKAFLPNKAQYFALGVASAGWGLERTPRATVHFVSALAAVAVICVAQGGLGKLAAPLVWTACLAAQRAVPETPGWWLLRRLAAILRAPPLLAAGAASYSIYLTNEPVQKVLGLLIVRWARGDGALFTLLWVPSAILLPLGFAWLLHKRVEQPALRAGRRLLASSTLVPA